MENNNHRHVILVTGIRGTPRTELSQSLAKALGDDAVYVSFDECISEHPWNQKRLSPKIDIEKDLLDIVVSMEVCDDFVKYVESLKARYSVVDMGQYVIHDGGMRFLADFPLWNRLGPSHVFFVTKEAAQIQERRQEMYPKKSPGSPEEIEREQEEMVFLVRAEMDGSGVPITVIDHLGCEAAVEAMLTVLK